MFRLGQYLRNLSPQFTRYSFCSSKGTDVQPIFEAKHSFGQGGTLNTLINNINMDIQLTTIWEDYASLKLYSTNPKLKDYLEFSENERNCYLKDSQLPEKLKAVKDSLLIIEIPEYYSLNLTNTGNVGFVKGSVSSNLCGNAKIDLIGDNSKFTASKIKGEFFEANIKKGSFNVTTFIESADFKLSSEDVNVNVKRFGLSGNALFTLGTGKIQYGSIYTGSRMTRGQGQETVANGIKVSPDMKDIEQVIQDVNEKIQKDNHVKIEANRLNLDVGHWQGSSIINSNEVDINLRSYEADRFVVNANQGDIILNLSRLGTEGLVCLNEGRLNLFIEKNLKVNLFSYKEARFIGREFVPGQPILLLNLGEKAELKFDEYEKKLFGIFPPRKRE